MPRSTTTEKAKIIHVVVVESHHHVLEHIHHVLRRRKHQSSRSRSQQGRHGKQPNHQQRRNFSFLEPWSMIHFDAHPDLACPNPSIPAAACFQPRREFLPLLPTTVTSVSSSAVASSSLTSSTPNSTTAMLSKPTNNGYTRIAEQPPKDLYALLDSTTSGIAEWILPLVLAANLSEIHWIRPHAQNILGRFPLGQHEYHVGCARSNTSSSNQSCHDEEDNDVECIQSFLDLPPTAVVKCDWDCLYYRDEALDSSYAPRNELWLAQPLKLVVEEIDPITTAATATSRSCTLPSSKQQAKRHKPWTLDICLDYFVCVNPFIVDIEALDPVFSKALTALVCQAKCYQEQENNYDKHNGCNASRQMLLEFRACFINLLETVLADLNNTTRAISTACNGGCATTTMKKMLMAPLLTFFRDSASAEHLVSCLIESLWESNDLEKQTKLVSLAIEALPHLTMPHTATISSSKKRRLDHDDDDQQSTIPSSATIGERTQRPLPQREAMLIAQMAQYIQEYQQRQQQSTTDAIGEDESHDEPFLVTIARSSQDGFTPSWIVESLQDGVLEAIHALYCNCGGKPKTPARPSSDSIINESPVTDTKALKCHPSASCENSNTNCRIQILFDYGCWEGSTLDPL